MASDALEVYDEQLEYILSEDAHFTVTAIYDPTGSPSTISGVFDDHTFRGNKDGGNVYQKKVGKRFVVKSILDFDIYTDKELTINLDTPVTYEIDYVARDFYGAQVLWLR